MSSVFFYYLRVSLWITGNNVHNSTLTSYSRKDTRQQLNYHWITAEQFFFLFRWIETHNLWLCWHILLHSHTMWIHTIRKTTTGDADMVGNCHLHGNIKLRQKTKKNVKCICHHESQLVVIIVRVFILLLFFPVVCRLLALTICLCISERGIYDACVYVFAACNHYIHRHHFIWLNPTQMQMINHQSTDTKMLSHLKQTLVVGWTFVISLFRRKCHAICYLYEQYAWNVDEANEPHTWKKNPTKLRISESTPRFDWNHLNH